MTRNRGKSSQVIAPLLSRGGIALVSAVTILIVIPAVSKQWNDREAELKLKSDLVTGLARAVTANISDARNAVAQSTLAHARVELICQSTPTVRREACWRRETAAVDVADAAAYRSTIRAWQSTSSGLEALMLAYFPRESSAAGFPVQDYFAAVEAFINLQTNECDTHRLSWRTNDIDAIRLVRPRRYTPAPVAQSTFWLGGLAFTKGCKRMADFTPAYYVVGESLISEEQAVIKPIIGARARAYSTTWRSFVGDIGWLGLGGLALGLVMILVAAVLSTRRGPEEEIHPD